MSSSSAPMQIIDAHHHLWDLEKHDHPWLKPDAAHLAGNLMPICRNYQLDDFLTDARQQSLVKSVHLQAGISLPESVEETAWLQEPRELGHDGRVQRVAMAGAARGILVDGALDARLPRRDEDVARAQDVDADSQAELAALLTIPCT